MKTSLIVKEKALEPRQRNQSLNQAITYQGSHQVHGDISTTDVAPVKRSYRVIDRRALKLAQFFAAIQESEWSYQSAVYFLKLAYGFPSDLPAPLLPLLGR